MKEKVVKYEIGVKWSIGVSIIKVEESQSSVIKVTPSMFKFFIYMSTCFESLVMINLE